MVSSTRHLITNSNKHIPLELSTTSTSPKILDFYGFFSLQQHKHHYIFPPFSHMKHKDFHLSRKSQIQNLCKTCRIEVWILPGRILGQVLAKSA